MRALNEMLLAPSLHRSARIFPLLIVLEDLTSLSGNLSLSTPALSSIVCTVRSRGRYR